MFTGIVEATATLEEIIHSNDSDNLTFIFTCPFCDDLTLDQSLSHNGVCLTVDGKYDTPKRYSVTAIRETLERSNLGRLRVGSRVNIERSMPIGGRLDGHIVQGHVDTTGVCTKIEDADGSRYFTIEYKVSPEWIAKGYVTVEKGSVCVNGVSLTVCDSTINSFRVAIIPYTLEHTNFGVLEVGDYVNLEFDILGKYLARMNELQKA